MIRALHELTPEAGGKALGLKRLREIGLKVPGTVVLIHPEEGKIDDDLVRSRLAELGDGPKAVRSSAMSEDGAAASFAGQFETFLDLRTYDEIRSAIRKCIEAAGAERVRAYSGKMLSESDLRISVILQNMVDARTAGVVFSADPVTHRRDKVVINAVAGKGEALVSGMEDARHFELWRSGSNIEAEEKRNESLLSKSSLREILDGTLLAEKVYGHPVDLEWAIDCEGILHWLQVRPVTTLDDTHYNEFDSAVSPSPDVWTLGNIGEMMPGVATPLTWSVSAETIDWGMVYMADRIGAFKLKERTGPRYIQIFYNRLFINLSNLMDYPKHVWLNKAADVQFAICGKVIPEQTITPESPLPRRVFNFIRQLRYSADAQRQLNALRKLDGGFSIDTDQPIKNLYTSLTDGRKTLGLGFAYHLGTSAQSGTLYSTFIRVMTSDKRAPEASDHHTATMLLLDIPDIESADAVKSLERFALLIRSEQEFASRFSSASPEEALEMLRGNAPPAIREQFDQFLERHGHRCVRESELREKTWAVNPLPLIGSIQARVRKREPDRQKPDLHILVRESLGHLPFFKRSVLRMLVPHARKAVARREITKALSIHMVDTIRKGYTELGNKLVLEGLLDDPDQVYFLTHEELGELINDRVPFWKTKANRRRILLPELDRLGFDEIHFGVPEPVEEVPEPEIRDGQLKGTPVSRGVVTGPARIVNSLEEASRLCEGDIMIAAFTDIGWTPWFSIIAGVVTEIGSPLSHGAVVAREYGIPAVVGAKGARRSFRDGEMVRVDGDRGIVEQIL